VGQAYSSYVPPSDFDQHQNVHLTLSKLLTSCASTPTQLQ
jgi:hypothetical protein